MSKQPQQQQKQSKGKSGGPSLLTTSVAALLAAGAVFAAVQTHGELNVSLAGPRHAVKRFHNFHEFFPFYLTEHSDPLTKVLHGIGTSIAVLFALSQPTLIFNTLTAVAVGFMACEALAGLGSGLAEGALMVLLYFVLNKITMGKLYVEVLVLAYGVAWFSHFFVEHNRPATFIYPSYSFASDFNMLFGLATGRIKLQ
jgi:hypothetical protein